MDFTQFKVLSDKSNFNWGNPDKMDETFLLELDRFLYGEKLLKPFVSGGTGGTHVANSEHPNGFAVDILFCDKTLAELPDIFLSAWRYKFTGIGIYSEWRLFGEKKGGLHLQMVPEQIAARKRMWLKATGDYEEVTFARQKELFL